jgi:uncharacterized membrane protein YwzB
MFWLNLLLVLISAYFVKEEYNNQRPIAMILWSILLGWDLNILIVGL